MSRPKGSKNKLPYGMVKYQKLLSEANKTLANLRNEYKYNTGLGGTSIPIFATKFEDTSAKFTSYKNIKAASDFLSGVIRGEYVHNKLNVYRKAINTTFDTIFGDQNADAERIRRQLNKLSDDALLKLYADGDDPLEAVYYLYESAGEDIIAKYEEKLTKFGLRPRKTRRTTKR